MADSMMDTDSLLDMSLDALIASKSKNSGSRSQGPKGGGGGGKVRTGGRATRQQQTQPYTKNSTAKALGGVANNRVYVGNLAWGVTWKELKDCMAQAGRVVKADVGTDGSGRSKVGCLHTCAEKRDE